MVFYCLAAPLAPTKMPRSHILVFTVLCWLLTAALPAQPVDPVRAALIKEDGGHYAFFEHLVARGGLHDIWLRVDCATTHPRMRMEAPDLLTKQAARATIQKNLQAAGLDVHLTAGPGGKLPWLLVSSHRDSNTKQSALECVYVDEYGKYPTTFWKQSLTKSVTGNADIQRGLVDLANVFLAKFKPYIRKKIE
jgi:hypothetical protein